MDELIVSLDQLIREGKDALARETLRKLRQSELTRAQRAQFAELARRVTLPGLSLQFMAPIVRPRTPLHPPANAKELGIYAAALTRIGAVREAMDILATKKSEPNTPELELYGAYAHFAQWDYLKAIRYLKRYLKSEQISPYQRLVGKVNLAAACVTERLEKEAEELLSEIVSEASANGYRLLLGNAHELWAQLLIFTKRFDRVEEHLSLSRDALASTKSNYEFFARKWHAIAEIFRAPNQELSRINLQNIRKEAQTRKEWDTVREADLYLAVSTNNTELLARVYWGTPFPAYRLTILKHLRSDFVPQSSYVYKSELATTTVSRYFDLTHGEETAQKSVKLKRGQMIHRGLQTLASDFYRPLSLGLLASNLFPDEHFDPHSTPAKVNDFSARLRAWMLENHVPVVVDRAANSYALRITGDYAFILRARNRPLHQYEDQLAVLKRKWPYRNFSSAEARDQVGSSAPRVLKWAVEKKKILRSGTGPATRYRFSV